jgi:aminoglycoside phosphotransferase (APT) family kinase protein
MAEPLWLEPEANALGGPFFVSRRVNGSNLGDVWGAAATVPDAVCLELASILARLHAADTSAVTLTPVRSMHTPEAVGAAIDELEHVAATSLDEPHPALAALLTWLRAHAPVSTAQPSLVHGDVGFHNLLVDDHHVTALLDWERSHLGDPAEDLVYLRPSLEPFFAWERFLDAYEHAGGRRPDPEVERFYRVWQDVWRHIACLTLRVDFDRSARYSSAVAGFYHGPRFLASAVQSAFGPVPTTSSEDL